MNQQDFAQMFLPPDIHKGRKALCIQPHPDDNEVGMGGIIPLLTADGCRVDYLTVTDGSLGTYTPKLTNEALIQTRKEETLASGKLLGVTDFHALGFSDGTLNDIPLLAGEIAQIIRQEHYDMIFAPDPWLSYEAHWDHVVTGRAAAQALISSSLLAYPAETNTPPASPFAIGFYFTNRPNMILDISDTFALKFRAMAAHKSQFTEELLALYRAYFTMRGQTLAKEMGFALGEGLRMMSPLHLHCFAEGELIGGK